MKMKRIEEMDFIDDCLHRMMVVARIGVENQSITKDEMAEYITTRANKTFCDIFEMNLGTFAMLCVADLIKDKNHEEIVEMVKEGKDEEV